MSSETTRRVWVQPALVLAGTFLLGVIAGVGVGQLWHRSRPRLPPPLPMLAQHLDLTPEQDQKANVIFEKYRPELDAIVKETFPRVRTINETMERELRAILTPEQGKKLDELLAHRPHGRGLLPGMRHELGREPPGMGPPGMPPPGEGPPPQGESLPPPPRGAPAPGN